MSWLPWAILIVVGAVALAPYVLGPWLVYRRTRADGAPRFEVADGPFPVEVEGDCERFATTLERCGFRRVERWILRSPATGQGALMQALWDETRSRWGIAYTVLDAGGRPALRYQEIGCALSDGSLLGVNNGSIGVFDVPPGWLVFGFPEVADGELLCRLHQTAQARFANGRTPCALAVERLRHEVEEIGIRHVRHQVAVGLLHLDGELLRPTARGALVMTWRLLWPWKQRAARRRRRGAMQLLSLLERSSH